MPSAWLEWLRRLPWLRWLPLAIAIVLALFLLLLGAPALIGLVLIVAGVLIANYLKRAVKTADAAATTGRRRAHASGCRCAADESGLSHRRAGLVAGALEQAAATTRRRRRFKLALREAARVEMAEGTIQPEVRTRAADRCDRHESCRGAETGEDHSGMDAAARIDSRPHPAEAGGPGRRGHGLPGDRPADV